MTNSFDRHPYLKTSTATPFVPAHKHVGDEGKPAQLVNPVVKKLTFEEWYQQAHSDKENPNYWLTWNENCQYEAAQDIWKAAQENVPSQAPGTGATA